MLDSAIIPASERNRLFCVYVKVQLEIIGLSQKDFCEKHELNSKSFSNTLSKGLNIGPKYIEAFANEIGINIDELQEFRNSDKLLSLNGLEVFRLIMGKDDVPPLPPLPDVEERSILRASKGLSLIHI